MDIAAPPPPDHPPAVPLAQDPAAPPEPVAPTAGAESDNLTRQAELMCRLGLTVSDDIRRHARHLLERAVALNRDNAAALNLLGEQLAAPAAAHRDPRAAADLWQRAADLRHRPAIRNLAVLLEAGDPPVPRDLPRAARLYSTLADDPDYKPVRFNLAFLLSSGHPGVPQDPARAADLYQAIVSESGDVSAIFNLACIVSQGLPGLPRDNARAARLYERAVRDASHPCSMHNLAVLLSAGDGLPRDVPRALALLERAVDLGRAEANFDLALLLANDDHGPPLDLPRAVAVYERVLRELQHMGAMINLAEVLWEGKHGVARDPARAMRLWEGAIAQGLCYDECALGRLGIHVERGEEPAAGSTAAQMRDHARAQGWHLIAMCNLAEMLLSGAVPRDKGRAMRLYETALTDAKLPAVCEAQEVEFGDTFKVLREMLRKPGGAREHWGFARRVYELLADGPRNAHAMHLLGEMYRRGAGEAEEGEAGASALGADMGRAVRMYGRAIEHGSREAMLTLGEMRLAGSDGVRRNVGHAVELFARVVAGASGGDSLVAQAAVYLAQIYGG